MVSWKTVQDSKGRTKTEYETLWKVDEMNDDLGTSADNPDVSTVRMPPGVELVFFGDVCEYSVHASVGPMDKFGLRAGKTANQVPLKILVDGKSYGGIEWGIDGSNAAALESSVICPAWLIPAAMTLNDKKPPRHAFEFAFKHDLSFKYELPVNGVMKECEVKVTYPILKSVDDCMCIVKDVKEKAMAIVCRGLLPGETLRNKKRGATIEGEADQKVATEPMQLSTKVGAGAAVMQALNKKSGASAAAGSLVLKTPKDARHLVK
ncbi:unnamed protein product [Symbiodinium natans]|uniref:Uncharacterized protein n=1 Tax=Symbiodinium natans TaxID=878477 RepID=A0A812I8T0_9DINO|nr:unnamed protein product [Symbiodinium natans]